MIKISHRGNIDGPQPDRENRQDYIVEAIEKGFHVEVDLWYIDGKLYLGHDKPEYLVDFKWLTTYKEWLWIHAKNIKAALSIVEMRFKVFFHEKERHTLICNTAYAWTHDLSEATSESIIPLLSLEDAKQANQFPNVRGICTDYPSLL